MPKSMFKCLAAYVSMLVIVVEGRLKWHTSQIVLNELYDLQNKQFSALDDYLDLETNRLDELKR